MKNLKEILTSIITSQPETLQFAKDRKFEEAWIISQSQQRPNQKEIDLYLAKEKFETLIVEYVWCSKDNDRRFVLTIFLDRNCLLKDPKKFIEISLDNFYFYKDFASLIENFDLEVVGQPYLLKKPVESVNLSVFNHWLSVGPVDLWKFGEKYDANPITNRIQSRPEILKTKLNFQGLFFRFNVDGKSNGPYYGIKTPCCSKVENEWIIDFEKVNYWMKLMLNI